MGGRPTPRQGSNPLLVTDPVIATLVALTLLERT